MRHDPVAIGKRRPVNVSLDIGIVAAAKEAGINMSKVTEAALRVAIKQERERQWQEEHREWIVAHNEWVEANGIPLSGLRAL